MKLESTGKKRFYKKPWFWGIIIALVVIIAIVGMDDSSIEEVKQGHPELIPNITYEEAYENFFGNPKWSEFTADTGEKVVEFTGDCTYYEEDARVYIQFLVEDDTFSLYYAHMKVGDETVKADRQTIVELIYDPFATYSEDVLGETLDDDVEEAFAEAYDEYN